VKNLLGLSIILALSLSRIVFGQVPDIPFEANANLLKLPENMYLGEVAGVATDAKGNIFVYTRTGENMTMGGSRFFTHGGSRLLVFDSTGKYLHEIGAGIYGFLFAQAVRVDDQGNIWTVDRGANTIIKFDPAGKFLMTLSRKPESINIGGEAGEGEGGGGRGAAGRSPRAIAGDNFNRPTDIGWDAEGDIFVTDSYTNARVVKLDKNGKFIKAWGSKGSGDGQFNMPNSLAIDKQGNVYVADLGNKRIQVFDNDGNFKTQYTDIGAPWAVCISPGAHQYLYSSNSNSPDSMENGEIYKMDLDGKVLGKFGTAGKRVKEFGTVNQIDCRNPNMLYVGELTNWRVQRLTLHASQ
jgi:DNA-binding beta-propeller fold protein YncE